MLTRIIIILTFSLIAVKPAQADWIPDFLQSELELLCQSCEEVLIDRLKSPSSYERLECSGLYTEKVTKEKYLEYHHAKNWNELSFAEKLIFDNKNYLLSKAFIEYEASNSYGAQIKSVETCQSMHGEDETSLEGIEISGPRVGGYTSLEWLSKRAKELAEEYLKENQGN